MNKKLTKLKILINYLFIKAAVIIFEIQKKMLVNWKKILNGHVLRFYNELPKNRRRGVFRRVWVRLRSGLG